MTANIQLYERPIEILTYAPGQPERAPLFLNKRVYQGSSGRVYPYPVTESVATIPTKQTYQAVVMANQWLKVTFLPQLGGRIYRMQDLTNGYDCVYYNHVIKPALVGLAGPWISGGIEFNWPQHHRPDTYLPVNYQLRSLDDDTKQLVITDVDRMYGTKSLVKFTMFADKAYLQVAESFSNPTDLPQTFLWWANPAVPVNDQTRSIFPPDVTAVFDHGKRAVSNFPIATGTYYKYDYSAGVDISRYQNVPVPTSFMAAHSDFDFLGNYDDGRQAGLLHVADHHTSPGKKQWTWGNGDFGRAWERQLTDHDGPYIELMVGTFTDNQPDFTWLLPHQTLNACEYFMPYKHVGAVKNATKDACVNLTVAAGQATIKAYATAVYHDCVITLKQGQAVLKTWVTALDPANGFTATWTVIDPAPLTVTITTAAGQPLVAYTQIYPDQTLPEIAQAMPAPSAIKTTEELWLAGQHLEQYRHASFDPVDYYQEGLRRDPGDIRLNQAFGTWLYRRGEYGQAQAHFRSALTRQNAHNTNPQSGQVSFDLGLCALALGDVDGAYDHFYKASWNLDTQVASLVQLAKIAMRRHAFNDCLAFCEEALAHAVGDIDAMALKACALRLLDRKPEAKAVIAAGLKHDPLAAGLAFEQAQLTGDDTLVKHLLAARQADALALAAFYLSAGQSEAALAVLTIPVHPDAMLGYYQAYAHQLAGHQAEARQAAAQAAQMSFDHVFPNRLFDLTVLQALRELVPADGHVAYLLGNWAYDKGRVELAEKQWQAAVTLAPDLAMAHRNLAIVLFNHRHAPKQAQQALAEALRLAPQEARLVMELDDLNQKCNVPLAKRLAFLQAHRVLVDQRDDSYLRLITLLNQTGDHEAAKDLIMARQFHPWEGGEGKVAAQYVAALSGLAKQATDLKQARSLYTQALSFPPNLGEGKLPIAQDNQLHYALGCVAAQLGEQAEAKAQWQAASMGAQVPSATVYYNDEPLTAVYYRGLAFKALGQTTLAHAIFTKMITYGQAHLKDQDFTDYFAVSIPDAAVFDVDLIKQNQVTCLTLIALGNRGLGERIKARQAMAEAAKLDVCVQWEDDDETNA